ncbi:PspC domain-containing protein [Actinomadura parmotrematis]|uniref:PspC domain-containing protein n=1 Tax=Actinomadura parmotrematis TaxID=2864039 RepID=A0ABS7FZN5_9ACTN|nr:PspC domain-containing protein [Actinomadura parmotrematis]MBW8485914.1 PspC domain-containing protein [Actinomadura parmotrematis]
MDFDKDTTAAPPPADTPPPADRRLVRTRDGRMLAGVCSGAGRYFGVDPNLVRLGLAAFTLFGGAGALLYAAAWLLLPEEGAATSVGEDLFRKANADPRVQDAVQKAKDSLNKDRQAR